VGEYADMVWTHATKMSPQLEMIIAQDLKFWRNSWD